MISLDEPLIPLREVCELIPSARIGKKLCFATVWRWMTRGARGRVLESVTVGASRYTTASALERFMHNGNGADADAQPALATRSPARRERDHRKACDSLDKAGVR